MLFWIQFNLCYNLDFFLIWLIFLVFQVKGKNWGKTSFSHTHVHTRVSLPKPLKAETSISNPEHSGAFSSIHSGEFGCALIVGVVRLKVL